MTSSMIFKLTLIQEISEFIIFFYLQVDKFQNILQPFLYYKWIYKFILNKDFFYLDTLILEWKKKDKYINKMLFIFKRKKIFL